MTRRRIALTTLVVPDYQSAIAFYCRTLDFELIEDTDLGGGKRWVRVGPDGEAGAQLLLARAADAHQIAAIGNQTGGRVAFFLETGDFARDHARLLARGVRFLEAPRHEPYGIVAVFVDPFGNKWDLIERAGPPDQST